MVRRPSLRVATIGVVGLCSLLVGSLATLPAPGSRPVGSDPDRAAPGGGAPVGQTPFHPVVLTDQNKPQVRVKTNPNQLHLKAASSKVFSLTTLKSNVIKLERPENDEPGLLDPDAPVDGSEEDSQVSTDTDAAVSGDSDQQAVPQVEAAAAPAPSTQFAGLDFFTHGVGHPPDTNGDVGPTYYIQTINASFGVFNKSTGALVTALDFNTFMSQGNFGNLCDTDNFGDPVVLYDTYEDRWFLTDFAFELDSSGNVSPQTVFQCFAVSKSGDPVNGGWNFYSIQDPGGLGDYPKFGVWPDGIYMSANMFDYSAAGGYQGYHVWAINKQQMYADAPTAQVVDFAGDTSDFTLLPANSRLQTGTPPLGRPEFFVSTEVFLNALAIYKFQVNWTTPGSSTFTGPFTQTAPNCWPNKQPANALTPVALNPLDVLSIRAMAQAQYTSIAGSESVWVDHTVNRGTFTGARCGTKNSNNATVRWYQANVNGGTVAPSVVQGATYDPDAANTYYRYVPSLALDRAGDMAVGYTKSNGTTNPQIKYAGRLSSDALNTLGQSEQTLINGAASQSGNCGGSPCQRWGDYSGMALDPNGCAFWMTGEYYDVNGLNYLTRIGSFSYPSCTTVGSGTLSGTVTDGASPIVGATVTLGSRTTTTNGTGHYSFTLPAGTYPTETASAAGFNSSTVNTIPVPSGGTATRNFTLTSNSATSTTLTATDASGTYGGTTSLSATLMAGANPVAGKSVSFSLNGTSVGSASTNASGVATLNNASLAGIGAGTYATGVSASWAGDGSFSASSDTAQLVVSPASTSVAVSSTANPSVFSQGVSFTANVTSAGGTPTGTVQFTVDGTNLGSPVAVDGTGKATSPSTTTMIAGSHSISAVYSGDANFATNSGGLSQTVNKAGVTVALTSNANPVAKGATITFTITVTSNAPATKTPVGKVRLLKNGTAIKTAHKLSGGKTTYTFTWTYAAGTFNMTAKYLGNANFSAAVSPIYSQVVTP